jgi:hypothetical protein
MVVMVVPPLSLLVRSPVGACQLRRLSVPRFIDLECEPQTMTPDARVESARRLANIHLVVVNQALPHPPRLWRCLRGTSRSASSQASIVGFHTSDTG